MKKCTVFMEIEVEVEIEDGEDAYDAAERELLDRGLYDYIRSLNVYEEDDDEDDCDDDDPEEL